MLTVMGLADRPARLEVSDDVRTVARTTFDRSCVKCHTLNGSGGDIGPDLTHVGSRALLGAGVLANTPENLARFVQHVQDVKPGVRMPSFATLPADDVQALVAYLEGLK